jgi:hypothetical protein
MLVTAAVVQLSCWASLGPLSADDDLKQSIRLLIGALKALGAVWPSGRRVLGQVEGVAREIFRERMRVVEGLFFFLGGGGCLW